MGFKEGWGIQKVILWLQGGADSGGSLHVTSVIYYKSKVQLSG